MAAASLAKDGQRMPQLVGIDTERVTNIASKDIPGHYPGDNRAWSLDKFKSDLTVKFHQNRYDESTFSIIGTDASIANAFRRILLAEVPTLAIEQVYIENNTSVIADEVLAHRLGLIPLKGDLEGLRELTWYFEPDQEQNIEGTEKTDKNTIVLNLRVKCERNPDAPKNATEPEDKYLNSNVYSRHIQWEAKGQQTRMFDEAPIEPVSPDILIAKLRPGQELHMTLHAHLGKGSDHAKFSPVATATYRLLPTITITKPIIGAHARKFQKCFPQGVIELQKVTSSDTASKDPMYQGKEGDDKAVVKDTMKDTVSRECLRHDEFKDKVKLGRVQDHFIFNIESTGQYPSEMLFRESVNVLKYKAKRLLRALDEIDT